MGVFIGVDPHKRVHAVVVADDNGAVQVRAEFPDTKDGFVELRRLGRRWKTRTWAIEGCNGVGKHLAQRLFAAGERVVDISTRHAALVRVYAGGNGRKNDDTDAHSIVMVALHTPDLPEVQADGRAVALRLLSHRRKELIGLRTQAVCRIHRDLQVLIPGGADRKLSAGKAKELLVTVRPRDEVGKLRRRLIADQIRDLERLDRQIADLDVELAELVEDTPTSLRDLYGVGVITTALVLGEVGNVARFQNKDHFASYNGTAPADRGSAGNPQPAVNSKGNRRLNHAIHVVAVTQVRNDTPARRLYARKISEGKTKKEALRVVTRRVSDAIYRQLVLDAERSEAGPGGQTRAALESSAAGLLPTTSSSDKPQPGPDHEPAPPRFACPLGRGVPICARAKFARRRSVLIMSWRWLVDTRGDKVHVDRPRLGITVAAALALATVLLWVVPSPWDYATVVVLAILGVVVDIRLRRRDGNT